MSSSILASTTEFGRATGGRLHLVGREFSGRFKRLATSSASSQNFWHFSSERHVSSSSLNVPIRSMASLRLLVGFCSISDANFAFFRICLAIRRYLRKRRSNCNMWPDVSMVRWGLLLFYLLFYLFISTHETSN